MSASSSRVNRCSTSISQRSDSASAELMRQSHTAASRCSGAGHAPVVRSPVRAVVSARINRKVLFTTARSTLRTPPEPIGSWTKSPSFSPTDKRVAAEEFSILELLVRPDRTATLTCDDGNGNVVYTKESSKRTSPSTKSRFYSPQRDLSAERALNRPTPPCPPARSWFPFRLTPGSRQGEGAVAGIRLRSPRSLDSWLPFAVQPGPRITCI